MKKNKAVKVWKMYLFISLLTAAAYFLTGYAYDCRTTGLCEYNRLTQRALALQDGQNWQNAARCHKKASREALTLFQSSTTNRWLYLVCYEKSLNLTGSCLIQKYYSLPRGTEAAFNALLEASMIYSQHDFNTGIRFLAMRNKSLVIREMNKFGIKPIDATTEYVIQ